MIRIVSDFILKKIIGWKITGNISLSKHKYKKVVIITAPHTHWMDFYLGLLIRGAINFKSNYLAKKELFKFPLSIFLKITGGIPVDRNSKNNTVDYISNLFSINDEFRLSIAPEGTRKRVDKFKSGFYYIAIKAEVPIILMSMDYKNKTSKISKPYFPTKNKSKDFEYFENFFDGIIGKVEKYSFFKKN